MPWKAGDVRKALEEFVAPGLTERTAKFSSLEATMPAMEARLLKTIEARKADVLLMVRVSDL